MAPEVDIAFFGRIRKRDIFYYPLTPGFVYALNGFLLLAIGIVFADRGTSLIRYFGVRDLTGWYAAHLRSGGLASWYETDLGRAAVFARMFGAALIAVGLATIGVWRTREAELQRALAGWFWGGNIALFAYAFFQQRAIWSTSAGRALVIVFFVMQTAYSLVWISRAGIAAARSTTELRGEWERRIREAAGQEERNRLARDLHDSIKQQIYAIQTHLAAAQARTDGCSDAVAAARESARHALAEMNAMLDSLRASPLETVGLVEALRRQCEALGHRTAAEVATRFGELPADLAPGMQKEIFRIAEEALSNIARHARANRVTLELEAYGDGVRLTIVDDGQGFDRGSAPQGMGLRNMQTRAASMGGTLEIASAAGSGCRIVLNVPRYSRTLFHDRRPISAAWAFAATVLIPAMLTSDRALLLIGLALVVVALYLTVVARVKRAS